MKFQLIAFSIILIACNPGIEPTEITTADEKAVVELLNQQIQAWNKGDYEGFMRGYWQSDSLRFCAKGGTRYGWNTTLNAYKKSFPKRDDMGTLRFEIDTIISSRPPYITVDGQWFIYRADTIGGNFVLLFEKKNNQWCIIEDHTW